MSTVARELNVAEAVFFWDEAESFLRDAIILQDKESFIRNVKARIFSGLHTLWKIDDIAKGTLAYAVTSIYTPDGLSKIAQIYLATTEDMEVFIQEMAQFEIWALKNDVSFIEIIGRKGWEKVLKPFGFRHNHTSLLKRIARELH